MGTAFMLRARGRHRVARIAPGSRLRERRRLTRAFTAAARGGSSTNSWARTAPAPARVSPRPSPHLAVAPAARGTGDADAINLWAGQGHARAQARPAGEIVRTLAADAARALADGSAGAAW